MTDPDLRRQQAIETLLTLIRKFATETLLEEIADGDSQAMQSDTPKHLAALHELRDEYDWRLAKQPNNHWHPGEPIGLISYAVDTHSKSAQIFCNALLLVRNWTARIRTTCTSAGSSHRVRHGFAPWTRLGKTPYRWLFRPSRADAGA